MEPSPILFIRFCPGCARLTKHNVQFTEKEVEFFVCSTCGHALHPHPIEDRGHA